MISSTCTKGPIIELPSTSSPHSPSLIATFNATGLAARNLATDACIEKAYIDQATLLDVATHVLLPFLDGIVINLAKTGSTSGCTSFVLMVP